jgi:3-isopropylmalate/(R)-2-methylmalate dehydratase small subunit
MRPFTRLDAVAMPLAQINVDTDQVVPARYLQKPRSDDFGNYLFRDLRQRADGTDHPDFPLNQPAWRNARVIVAGRNFGCGSSREHAVWALYDYGFRAAIAPSFGDIFAGNSLKNGFLPVVLPEQVVVATLAHLEAHPGARIAVDLEAQQVVLPDSGAHGFDIAPFARRCLLEGLDEIDYTLSHLAQLQEFERRHAADGL